MPPVAPMVKTDSGVSPGPGFLAAGEGFSELERGFSAFT